MKRLSFTKKRKNRKAILDILKQNNLPEPSYVRITEGGDIIVHFTEDIETEKIEQVKQTVKTKTDLEMEE